MRGPTSLCRVTLVLAFLPLHRALTMTGVRPRPPCIRCDVAMSMMPSSDLSAADVVRLVCEGLRDNDTPKEDAGIERLYNFLTPQGRVAIAPTPPKSGLQGGVELDYFLEEAGSPAMGALIFCSSFELIGEARITPGSNARGALCTQLIEVRNCPLADEGDASGALSALVRASDDFLDAVITSVREGSPLPEAPLNAMIKRRFWVQLEQQRRPPNQGCWFIKEFLPLQLSKFQQLNDGGEEFEGDDPN